MGRSESVCEGVWDGMGRSESVCEGVWGGVGWGGCESVCMRVCGMGWGGCKSECEDV